LLQEFVQARGVDLPEYKYVQVGVKAHLLSFRCHASFGGIVSEALGSSKKKARQKAAYLLLKKLRDVDF
jgi:dsRNA-specific ribonuclease